MKHFSGELDFLFTCKNSPGESIGEIEPNSHRTIEPSKSSNLWRCIIN